VDKFKTPKIVSIFGALCIIVGFSLVGKLIFKLTKFNRFLTCNLILGPVQFLPIETTLTIVIIGLVFHGLGIALLLVSTFSDALRTAVQSGFKDGTETYGLVSGLWASVFAFGAFMGPSLSGYLFDMAGFRVSVIFIIVTHVLVAIVFTLFVCCSNEPRKIYKELAPEENLIRKSNASLHSSRSRNGSIVSSTQHLPIPIAMNNNNMMIASSYGKSNHWQRIEEASLGLLTDITRDDTYGTIEHDYHRETIA
jgi:MFS family permease